MPRQFVTTLGDFAPAALHDFRENYPKQGEEHLENDPPVSPAVSTKLRTRRTRGQFGKKGDVDASSSETTPYEFGELSTDPILSMLIKELGVLTPQLLASLKELRDAVVDAEEKPTNPSVLKRRQISHRLAYSLQARSNELKRQIAQREKHLSAKK